MAPPPIPQNAISAGTPPPPPVAQNLAGTLRIPQRPAVRRPAQGVPTTTTVAPSTPEYEYYDYEEEPKSTRTRRAIPVKVVLPPGRQEVPQTSFTCQDKLAGGVYADVETDCQYFHICVPIGKGKLLDYGLLCDEGTAFNQETGTCDERDSFSCTRSIHFAKVDKTKTYLADKKPWASPKSARRVIRDVSTQDESQTDGDSQERSQEEEQEVVVELPLTSFTCEGKTVGGYYADVETGCRMFHICAQTDMRFLCTNGTVFDQKSLVCRVEEQVSCEDAPRYYVSGFNQFLEREKYRPQEEAREQRRADSFESTKVKSKYPKKVGDFHKLSRIY